MVLYLRGPVNWCANQLLKPPSQGTSTHYLCYMIQKDIELERAKALDGAFKIIDKHYPKDLSSDPVYLKYHLQEKLKIENFLLLKYLKEESKVFQITKESSQGSETEADVSLFPEMGLGLKAICYSGESKRECTHIAPDKEMRR